MRTKLFNAAFVLAVFSVFFIGFSPAIASAEGDVNPFRVQLNAGLPEIVGLGVEYVLPVMDDKLALHADFSSIDVSGEGTSDVEYRYYSVGLNYYFFGEGEGLYLGASYGNAGLTVTDTYTSAYGNTFGATADAQGDIDATLMMAKIGYRAVLGFFTIGIEAGITSVDVSDATIQATYVLGPYTETRTETVPTTDAPEEGAVGKIYVGFAF